MIATLPTLVALFLLSPPSDRSGARTDASPEPQLLLALARRFVEGRLGGAQAEARDGCGVDGGGRESTSASPPPGLRSLQPGRPRVVGDEIVVRMALGLAPRGSDVPGPPIRWDLRFAREGRQWRVMGCEPSEQALAAALLEAKDEGTRSALLADEGEPWTKALEAALVAQAERREGEGRWADAAAVYETILALAEKAGDKPAMAEALRDLGYAAAERNDHAAVLRFHLRALALAEELQDPRGQLKSNNNLGVAYADMGNYAEALRRYQRALSFAGDGPYLVPILTNIGAIYDSQGDHAAARAVLERALARAEATENPRDELEPLNNLGAAFANMGDNTRALPYFERFLELAQESGVKPRIALALDNIGNVLSELGRSAEARDHLDRSARLAEEIGDRRDLLLALKDLARLTLSERKLEEALPFAERCTALARELDAAEELWVCRALVGRAHRLAGRAAAARDAYLEAIEIGESLRDHVAGGEEDRVRFFEDKLAPYHGMIDLTAAGKPLEALSYAERAKGRVLFDVLRNGRADVAGAMSPEERSEEKRLAEALADERRKDHAERAEAMHDPQHLAALDARLEKARLEYEGFRIAVYAVHPELRVKRGELLPPTLEEMGRLLGPDTVLLEYAVGEEAAYLFVVSRRRGAPLPTVEVVRLASPTKGLAEQVGAFRRSLAERSPDYAGTARRLYDLLLRPVEAELKGPRDLVIVPDGPLWELPFQALMNGSRHLLELHAISYAPSFSVLGEMTRPRPGREGGGLLAVGDPTFSAPGEKVGALGSLSLGAELAPLPESRREVLALGSLYGPESRVYTGQEAREDVWKREAPRARVLHLASHGILDDRSPLYSHVLLAGTPSSGEDGRLEAREILDLDLKADLAVLSACETGRGRIGSGEGVIGLSWALLVAGCPSAVVSLWKVDSSSTTRLMLDFHRALLSTPRSTKAAALRAAALDVMRSGSSRHPFYWAGFSVVGSNAPLSDR